ncbi:MAG: hypothetical protein C5B49_13555 [Bdellovibrio sp.]|nr:MAG: hypothetical protein C5B49_13555 [Bdellovibrio sp.]
MNSDSRRPFVVYFLLSLMVHVTLWLIAKNLPRTPPPPQFERLSMDVVETPPAKPKAPVPPESKDKLKVVDQAEKPLNDEIDDKAKYLSAHNQKVVKETIAKEHGEFKNVTENAPPGDHGRPQVAPEPPAPEPPASETAVPQSPVNKFLPRMDIAKVVKDRQEMEEKFDKDADFRKQKMAERIQQKSPQAAEKAGAAGGDTSKTLDYIKELDPGLESLLSTKEFKFYTYFSRIRQQLNQHWSPRVRSKVQEMYRQGRSIASSTDLITRCLVTLDKNGKLLKVQIIGDSGVRELDEAAVDSFRAAAPFPNPPKGMIDEDGTIKIRWDFILEA